MRYEIGLCIKTGYVVWAYGGLPCGECNDLQLAQMEFVNQLEIGEQAVADSIYRDWRYFVNAPSFANYERHNYNHYVLKRIMTCHENVNARLKSYSVMSDVFRRPIREHCKLFKACLNLVQVGIENGEPLPQLNIVGY